jgi:hypothetical protein
MLMVLVWALMVLVWVPLPLPVSVLPLLTQLPVCQPPPLPSSLPMATLVQSVVLMMETREKVQVSHQSSPLSTTMTMI